MSGMVCRYGGEDGHSLLLWCPGCEGLHMISLGPDGWSFDGDTERPTISPSIKVGGVQWSEEQEFHKPRHHVAPGEQIICHSFVREGRWEFLSDSTHHLAGQTVDMAPLPDWLASKDPS